MILVGSMPSTQTSDSAANSPSDQPRLFYLSEQELLDRHRAAWGEPRSELPTAQEAVEDGGSTLVSRNETQDASSVGFKS